MGFTREQLLSHHGAEVDDLLGDRVDLLFVGINPSLWTAATGTHFAYPGNRFYPALHRAGITERLLPAAEGMAPADVDHLLGRGIGITNLAARATARADELSRDELRAGGARLLERVASLAPAVVAVVGVTAYRSAFGAPKTVMGPQPEGLGASRLWVLPNPSGLNAHETVDTLAAWYALAADAAGIERYPVA